MTKVGKNTLAYTLTCGACDAISRIICENRSTSAVKRVQVICGCGAPIDEIACNRGTPQTIFGQLSALKQNKLTASL